MANLSILRRSRAGTAGSYRHVQLTLLALLGSAALVGLAATRTLVHPSAAGPAPRFLRSSLGTVARPSTSSAALPARSFASMRSAVTPAGLRVSAKWADLAVTSLDAGTAKWTRYATGAARTTSFGTETVSLSGLSGEEFLTVTKHRGSHTWRWLLDTSLVAHVNQNGEIGFTDAGKTVLLHVGAPTVLDAQGHPLRLAGLHWGLAHEYGRQVLTLRVNDLALPTPYTIDPSVSLSGAAYTAVKGSGQSGSFTLTIPAGAANGDLLIVQLAVRSNGAVAPPAGWSLFASSANGVGLSQYIYTRTMAAPDVAGTTAYIWTIPSGIDAAGGLVALRNVDGAPTNPSQQTALGTGTTSPASATVTTDSIIGNDSDYVLAFYGGQANFTFTETNASLSSIWTSATNQIPNGSGQLNGGTVSSGSSGASRAQAAISAGLIASSTGVTPSATLSASGNPWIVHVLAFRPALPYNQVVPTVSGTVAVGQTLTAATGTWSNSPTAFTYQWLRCDSAGANCVSIGGATSSTYVPVGADSGSTVRVRVGASNALGSGATAQSTQTVLVPAANGSGTLTTPTTSVTAGATGNTVTFTYTAATGGLSAGKVQLTVPAGWTAPSTTGANAGFTTSSTGTLAVAGQVITVSNVTIAAGATLTITYGSKASGGAGATASTTAGSQSWSAAEASTSGGTVTALASSPSITVSPGAATKVAWSQQPTSTGAGSSINPSPTVAVQDTYGNTVTSSAASIAVAIGTNPGGATLSGTTTVSAVGGIATFSSLSLNNVGTGYTLQATSTGLSPATSSTFNVAVGAPAKLALVQQPTTVSAGSSISPSVMVAIQDAAGNTVTTSSASVAVAIGTNPGVGTLSGTTTVSASSGVATFANLSIDKVGTGYTLAFSATGLTAATSSAFNVNAGAAAKLTFVQQPTSATAGSSLSPAVTVAVTDAFGNTVTSSAATITMAIGTNPSGGSLSGTTSTAASSGVASFANLSIGKGGTGYTLAASSTGLTGATSSSFNINVGAVDATQSTVAAAPASVTADGTTTSTVTVTAKDAFGNLISGQSVSLTQAAGSSTISPPSATTNGSGVATFTVKDTTAEAVTYTATIGATTILQTAGVTFTAGAVTGAQSTVSASPSSVTANGVATSTVTVTLKDANNNVVSGKTVTLAGAPAGSTINPASAPTNGSGVATFTVKTTTAG
ncbi:MAG TPA: invasin domain 3-containing protein, partial [Gaiellaceae bacterium]|nr:invasin domain 3-containing protein [Gaiellaceae bacterium]